jgi:hypothetical protein
MGSVFIDGLIGRPLLYHGLNQAVEDAPRLADRLIDLRHPVIEVAVVELPAIDQCQRNRRRRQHYTVGRIVRLVVPRLAAATCRVGRAVGRCRFPSEADHSNGLFPCGFH